MPKCAAVASACRPGAPGCHARLRGAADWGMRWTAVKVQSGMLFTGGPDRLPTGSR